MANYHTGQSSMGTADDALALDELMYIGPVQAYLVKSPTVTFWRFRYPRYAHFVMLAEGRSFQGNSVRFGQTFDCDLGNTTADLAYNTYLVAEIPAIHARTKSRRSAPVTTYPSNPTRAAREADRKAYRAIGALYADPRDDNLTEIGYSEMQLRDYGAARKTWNADSASTSGNTCSNNSTSTYSSSSEPFAYWANAIGQLLIKRAMMIVNGHTVDTLTSEYLYMWEELTGKAGKRLREMIGKRRSVGQLKTASTSNQRVYVPLPFYYTYTSGNAFPLCASSKRNLTVRVEFEKLRNLIIVSGADVDVVRSSTNQSLKDDDLEAWIDQTYVWISLAQRRKFAGSNFDQLITQVQTNHTPYVKNKRQVSIPLKFSHPLIEMMFAVRLGSRERTNQWFNFSGIDNRDPIDTVSLRVDNKWRIKGKDASYFRKVVPYQSHSNIPKGFIYTMSFALDAESDNPNGATSFANFNSAELILDLQTGMDSEDSTVLIFGRGYNIMRFDKMTVGVMFN